MRANQGAPPMKQVKTAGALAFAAAVIVATIAGCGKSAPPLKAPPRIFASAEEVELNFRGRTFVLGGNNQIAEVRPPDWPRDKFLKLPFWFGVNVLVPGVMAPKEGDFYVISEAALEKPLDTPGEWMIEAGSSLVKQETVFVTTRTRYLAPGKILPTIVQYIGKREFKRPDGKTVNIPVLREVSLPMKWTLGGAIPASYARYRT
jgi:predicted small lipoprotein YifL